MSALDWLEKKISHLAMCLGVEEENRKLKHLSCKFRIFCLDFSMLSQNSNKHGVIWWNSTLLIRFLFKSQFYAWKLFTSRHSYSIFSGRLLAEIQRLVKTIFSLSPCFCSHSISIAFDNKFYNFFKCKNH